MWVVFPAKTWLLVRPEKYLVVRVTVLSPHPPCAFNAGKAYRRLIPLSRLLDVDCIMSRWMANRWCKNTSPGNAPLDDVDVCVYYQAQCSGRDRGVL